MADSAVDLDDWELLLGPEASENDHSMQVLGDAASDYDGGFVKFDYFELDSDARYPNRAASIGNLQRFGLPTLLSAVEVSPSDSQLESPGSDHFETKKETTLGEIEGLQNDPQVLLSDEPLGLKREGLFGTVLGDDERVFKEVEDTGMSLENVSEGKEEVPQIESLSNGSELFSSCELLAEENENFGGSVVGDNFSGIGEEDRKETDSCCEGDCEESATANENSRDASGVGISSEGVSSVEKSKIDWWKLPMEFLKFCTFRMKPVWSISVIATLLGAFILTKKLYRMKNKTRTIPLKISFENKKASQLKIQAARLNEAFSVVRPVPVIRAPLLSNNGSSPWPLVGFQ